jgi:DNA invertase Pin-like site-specific DNA recombinase
MYLKTQLMAHRPSLMLVFRWLKRHRMKAVQWFEDRDSATNMRREAFQQLQAAIFAGTITTVIVWKLDRLARSLKEGVYVLADWCKRGVRVIAITQQIDLSGPVGHLIASLLFGIAEMELQSLASQGRDRVDLESGKARTDDHVWRDHGGMPCTSWSADSQR